MVIEATPGNRDLLAGELALGVLDGAERAEALRLMVADRAFALSVERWRDELGALFAGWPEEAPPPPSEGDGGGEEEEDEAEEEEGTDRSPPTGSRRRLKVKF